MNHITVNTIIVPAGLLIPCNTCGSANFRSLFSKKSSLNELYHIVKCRECGLVQVNPQPSPEETARYYHDEYFLNRSDRGYDNYYSEETKREIERVFRMNLEDLGFNELKPGNRTSLDIGCAAGYFVNYMKTTGWDACGIEIAEGPGKFARETLGLKVYNDDFLKWDTAVTQRFGLITLWATIEHLHKPQETIAKAVRHLLPGGMLIVTTCRYGLLARIKGVNWRFLNVPEHLYYYSLSGLIRMAEKQGLQKHKYVTYGSGFTSRKGSGRFYKTAKWFADRAVKLFNQGDMMGVSFIRPR